MAYHEQQISGSSSSRTSKPPWVTPPSSQKPPKRSYRLQYEFKALERQQHVTSALNSGEFRSELENILHGQLTGRKPPRPPKAIQERVLPASQMEAGGGGGIGMGVGGGGRFGQAHPFIPGVVQINDLRGVNSTKYTIAERLLRCKLAALCRLVQIFGWGQLTYNHITTRASSRESHFLVNPYGLMFHEVTASSLVKVNLEGIIADPGGTQLGLNKDWFAVHSAIYAARPDVRCVAHVHTTSGAAVSSMSCGLLAISQEAALVGGVSYHQFRGDLWDEAQREKLAEDLGAKNKVLIFRNHGVIAMGSNVEEAFYYAFHLLKACEIQVSALSAGLTNLVQTSEQVWVGGRLKEVVATSAHAQASKSWKVGELEFEALMRMLDNMGYNTGYSYNGLALLEPPPRSPMSKKEREEKLRSMDKQSRSESMAKVHTEKPTAKKSEEDLWTFLAEGGEHDRASTAKDRHLKGSALASLQETRQEDVWDFLDPKKKGKKGKDCQKQQTPSLPFHVVDGDTSEDTSEGETSASHSRRRRARHTQQSSRLHTKSPPSGSHIKTGKSDLATLSALEKTQYMAERVANSTGAAVEKLATQTLPRDARTPDTPNESVPSQKGLRTPTRDTTGTIQSGDNASPRERLLYMATPPPSGSADVSSLQNTSSRQGLSTTKLNSRGSSQEMDSIVGVTRTGGTFLHHPADIEYPDGLSPAEMAAFTAKVIAGSTSTAVQKLSSSLTENSTSGFSGLVSPVT